MLYTSFEISSYEISPSAFIHSCKLSFCVCKSGRNFFSTRKKGAKPFVDSCLTREKWVEGETMNFSLLPLNLVIFYPPLPGSLINGYSRLHAHISCSRTEQNGWRSSNKFVGNFSIKFQAHSRLISYSLFCPLFVILSHVCHGCCIISRISQFS